MGLRDAEYDRTDREQHQAELRKQLLRLNDGNFRGVLTVEQLEEQIRAFGETPVKPAKGRHRKPKK